MKKTFLCFVAILCCTSLLRAQEEGRRDRSTAGKGFYLRAGMGYNFPQAGGTLDNTGFPYNGSVTNASNGDIVYNMKNASFSSGFQGQLAIGYMLNRYLGFELGMSIGLANTKYTGIGNNVTLYDTISGNLNITQHAQTPVLLMPCIVLQNGGNVFNAYARFGIVLPLATKISQEQSQFPSGTLEVDVYDLTLKNSFSLGFTGAIGVQYNTGTNTSLYAELNMLSMSLYPEEADLTGASMNGSPIPLSYFSSTSTQLGHNITIPAGGGQQPTYALPFSNIGIHLGVVYKFQHHDYNKGRHVTPRHYGR